MARRLNSLRSRQSSVRTERNTARGGSKDSALSQVDCGAMLRGAQDGAAAEEFEGRNDAFAPGQMRPYRRRQRNELNQRQGEKRAAKRQGTAHLAVMRRIQDAP